MREDGPNGSDVYWLTEDHLGSVALATDEDGEQHARHRYYPYGAIRTEEGTMPTDKLFTGQQRESADGVYHYGARMYDTALGRMPQPDPLVPDPYNPQSYNAYSYVINNPANYTDPTGMFFWSFGGNMTLQGAGEMAVSLLQPVSFWNYHPTGCYGCVGGRIGSYRIEAARVCTNWLELWDLGSEFPGLGLPSIPTFKLFRFELKVQWDLDVIAGRLSPRRI